MDWVADYGPHLEAIFHALIVLVAGATLLIWRITHEWERLYAAAAGLMTAFLVATIQVTAYVLVHFGASGFVEWVRTLGVVGSAVEFLGVLAAMRGTRAVKHRLRSHRSVVGFLERAMPFSVGAALLAVLLGLVFLLSPRAPTLLEGSTDPASDCFTAQSCDLTGNSWKLDSDGSGHQVIAHVQRGQGPLIRDDAAVTVSLRSTSPWSDCAATVRWRVADRDGTIRHGTLRGSDDEVETHIGDRFTFTAQRTDEQECAVMVRLEQ